MRKVLITGAAALAVVSGCSVALTRPGVHAGRVQRPLPEVVSRVEGVTVKNVRREGEGTDQPTIHFDVSNDTDKAITYYTVRTNKTTSLGIYRHSGRPVVEPWGTHPAWAVERDVPPGGVIAITQVLFDDGEERGDEKDKQLRHSSEERRKRQRGEPAAPTKNDE
jgi:hypothetical protein